MKKKKTILIVDDVELNRAFLHDMLEEEYDILEAVNGVEAIELLEHSQSEIAVVLLDAVMPEMDGFEVLEFMNKTHWIDTIPVIMISAETSTDFISKGYNLGVIDYIGRPYNAEIVMHRVKNTIILYAKQRMLQTIVTEQIREMEDNNSLMVDILSTIVEFRNGESGVHVQRIRIITEILLEALTKRYPQYPFTALEIAEISNAAALHDVGKITIPDEILNKPGKLTVEEFEIIKTHSEKGAQILEKIQVGKQGRMLGYATNICRWHHERWDGKGYPDGLVGDEIPICAQVVAIADVYDALVSKRVYKPALTQQQAVQMILNGECGAFNNDLLECFLQVSTTLEDRIHSYEGNPVLLFDAEKISSEIITSKGSLFSSRTVALLEQERIKNQFFASLSNEIQFEYEMLTDTLYFSDKGSTELNIPLKITNAVEWLTTGSLIDEMSCREIFEKVDSATVDNPIVQTSCVVQEQTGSPKWYEITMRILWSEELSPIQYGCIGKLEDINEQKVTEVLLKNLAECDTLTQLYNHAAAKKKIKERLKRSGISALLFFDIDNFKTINDTCGHLMGDSVLKQFAESILSNIRASDIAARVGGDEFLVFAGEFSDGKQLNEWVNRLWRTLQSPDSGRPFTFTVSMGIAITADEAIDYDTLLSQADQSLYHCKYNGKNQYAYFNTYH